MNAIMEFLDWRTGMRPTHSRNGETNRYPCPPRRARCTYQIPCIFKATKELQWLDVTHVTAPSYIEYME